MVGFSFIFKKFYYPQEWNTKFSGTLENSVILTQMLSNLYIFFIEWRVNFWHQLDVGDDHIFHRYGQIKPVTLRELNSKIYLFYCAEKKRKRKRKYDKTDLDKTRKKT